MSRNHTSSASFFRQLFEQKIELFPIGQSVPLWLDDQALNRYVAQYLRPQWMKVYKETPNQHHAERAKLLESYPLSFQEFGYAVKDQLEGISIPTNYRKGSFQDYKNYLSQSHPQAKAWFATPFDIGLISPHREKHTLLLGQTGSGKSECLKLVFLSCLYERNIANHKQAIILLDSHGDLAQEVTKLEPLHASSKDIQASLETLNERIKEKRKYHPLSWAIGDPYELQTSTDLVYIDPGLCPQAQRFVCINIFDIDHEKKSTHQIDAFAQSIVRALSSMISAESQSFTANMVSLLIPLITVLLKREGSSLRDLARFLLPDGNDDLKALGLQASNPAHQDFFRHLFDSSIYRATRQALSVRLQLLLNDYTFASFLAAGASTINLEEAINHGKIIIFNLSKLGMESKEAAGRLLHGLISGFAFARVYSEKKRTPIHYLIDEFQSFVSSDVSSILVEARKFKLHLTLATQTLDQIPSSLAKVVLGNTAIKLVGSVGYSTRSTMARELFVADTDMFEGLRTGQFLLKSGSLPLLKVQLFSDFVANKGAVSPSYWKQVQYDQLKRYYRLPQDQQASVDHSWATDHQEPPDTQVDVPHFCESARPVEADHQHMRPDSHPHPNQNQKRVHQSMNQCSRSKPKSTTNHPSNQPSANTSPNHKPKYQQSVFE